MKKTVLILVGTAVLAASAFAMAGGPTAIKTSGFYGGTDLGLAYMASSGTDTFVGLSNSQSAVLKAHGVREKHEGFTIGGHGGYQFNRYMALEGGYMRFPKTGIKANGSFIGAKNVNVTYLDARASYPVGHRFSVFGKVGYSAIFQGMKGDDNVTNQKVKHHTRVNYAPLAGTGVEYRVTHKLGLNLQYTAYINTHHNSEHSFPTTNTVTLGLNYYF